MGRPRKYETHEVANKAKREMEILRKRAKRLAVYGLTLADYDEMVKKLNGLCPICGSPPQQSFSLDHDHLTGKFRGLLCSFCNTALGLLRDNKNIMARAIAYLEKFEDA